MIRLVLGDLRTHPANWLGPIICIAAGTLVLSVSVAFADSGIRFGGGMVGARLTTAAIVGTLSAAALVLVLIPITKLSVALKRRDYALWKLAGVAPTAIARVVRTQLLVVAMVGALIGTGLAITVVPEFITGTFANAVGLHGKPVDMGIGGCVALVLIAMGIVYVAGAPAARSAARTPPLTVLQESTPPCSTMTWKRWGASSAPAIAVVLTFTGMLNGDRPAIVGCGLLLGPLLMFLIAGLGPAIFHNVVTAWTALFPSRLCPSWLLARRRARHNAQHTVAAITPLMVAITLVGTCLTVTGTATNGIRVTRDVPLNYYNDPRVFIPMMALLIGGPVLLAAIGTAVAIFVSGNSRRRENALLRASGATPGAIIRASILEAAIYTTTAWLLAVACVTCVGTLSATALSMNTGHIVAPYFPLAETGVVYLAGLTFILAATVLPTAISLRTHVPTALARP